MSWGMLTATRVVAEKELLAVGDDDDVVVDVVGRDDGGLRLCLVTVWFQAG